MVVISDAYNMRKIKNVKINKVNAVSTHSTFSNAFVPEIRLAFPVNLPTAERYASMEIIFVGEVFRGCVNSIELSKFVSSKKNFCWRGL